MDTDALFAAAKSSMMKTASRSRMTPLRDEAEPAPKRQRSGELKGDAHVLNSCEMGKLRFLVDGIFNNYEKLYCS